MDERQKIEREIIFDILVEASKWRLSEGDETDTIRLEVMDRAKRLLIPVPADQSAVTKAVDSAPKPKPKSRRSTLWNRRKSLTHVRIKENGHIIWIPREEAEKGPARNGKWKWQRKTITQ